MLLQHPDSSKEGDLLGKCSFMARESPAHVFSLLIWNLVCFSWLAAPAEASGEAEMERTPKNLWCWPRGCSLGAVEQQGWCLSSQRTRHKVGGDEMPAREPTGWDISPGCRVPAHRNQQLKGSIAVAPVFSNSEEILQEPTDT